MILGDCFVFLYDHMRIDETLVFFFGFYCVKLGFQILFEFFRLLSH